MAEQPDGSIVVNDHKVCIGIPDEWRRFDEDLPEFLPRIGRLFELARALYARDFATDKPLDRIIFSIGTICWEDFDEILLLAGNGRGFGCQKILRGMFERQVTMSHLRRHPEEVEAFLDFHYISDYKTAQSILSTLGEYEGITQAAVDAKKKLRDAVLPKFRRPCMTKDCEREVDGFSWSTAGVVQQANGDKELKELVGIAYYIPMGYGHATVQSILSHMDNDGDGVTLGQRYDKARSWAARVLCAAHTLTLHCMALQLEHFSGLKPVLEPQLKQCVDDFTAIYLEEK